MNKFYLIFLCAVFFACAEQQSFDVIIANGTVYDGTGQPGVSADIGINADTIAYIGDLSSATAIKTVDASGMAVAPGFINMLSWAVESLIEDGRSMGDIKQGVTLEVFGEGWSMGPLSEEMRLDETKNQGEIKFDLTWTTLGEYLEYLEEKGISPNVASFVGATTLRIHQVGKDDRPPTDSELDSMRILVRQAMEEGALGIGSSLIYAPAFYASTEELIALCEVAAEYNGTYISHMRSEGNRLLESVDELLRISSESGIDAEIYHLKAAGSDNWDKMDQVIAKVDSARNAGLNITADMYTYTAGATGLNASMPPWVQAGGYEAWAERLKDPATRARLKEEIATPSDEWENLYLGAGSTDNVVLVGFKNDSLRFLTGKTLTEAAEILGKDPIETMMDLVIADGSRVGTVYFMMTEENIKKKIQIPWMRFGSDAGSLATEGTFIKTSTHPRAYGNFARLLGKYVREEKVIPMEEAIHKLTLAPATTLKIKKRGKITPGYFADLAIFDPNKIQDNATFEEPHQYSEGMVHVFVNGEQVLANGEHTNKFPGRAVRGPGWKQ
ncbi:MAG: D-aminoacylase [Cyclobacteriaceae bacterium]